MFPEFLCSFKSNLISFKSNLKPIDESIRYEYYDHTGLIGHHIYKYIDIVTVKLFSFDYTCKFHNV